MGDALSVLVTLGVLFFKEILAWLAFITGSTTFPQPLTPEEEKKYILLYSKGDEEARNILIEHNLRLVAHIVKKFASTGEDMDDLISIGTIGLIKAISTFNYSKGSRLATYAARCIENEILMNLRSTKKIKSEVYLQEPIGVDKEGNEISLIDVLGTEVDAVTDEITKKFQNEKLYEKISTSLKSQERKVIELRYGLFNGVTKTQREIAKILGISRSYVSRIEKRAIKKLSKELNDSFKPL
ncbi:RNA polymerase sigma-28 factor [Tepidanaerobacter acetatoxydans Re1]|uniref:RNA polymerase sigma factor n=1 Tax=Tepidanaerobacter acetatoxydans (strain DSM 21804 / JCM 16047 / Re1) TaxID=1209989 RepID=F4LVI1_TEPAE|nr:RNA polymerase sporulation sigma factor SigK [Tepidanaerobacter acetatoxydans]AEE91567.1 RNA polymerase, sigma 28 subunit, SigK [Tepidanaerobacter acetatoxydans Re1]CDI40726.1 RNA polymerase sigma-28 factor [Tepidanaerobacter acetatoxydans Re1]